MYHNKIKGNKKHKSKHLGYNHNKNQELYNTRHQIYNMLKTGYNNFK
jgi:hypothetical protein